MTTEFIPSKCPSCENELIFSNTGVDLMCPNIQNCPSQVQGRLTYYCQRNLGNITGLSQKQIEKFMELFQISDIPDLYDLPFEKIQELEGFGKKSVENLTESIEKSRHIQDFKFLASLGIDGVGVEVAKLICQKLES